jgi:NIMA (never in mitosis gene a)-related kinase
MAQLYKKVMKGQYDRVPKQYSKDLQIVIKSMLQVKPKYRPTINQLFEHEIIQTHLKQ